MKNKRKQAQALLDAMEEMEASMLQQAYTTDTPEKFRALGMTKATKVKKDRPVTHRYQWGAVAACLAVAMALAISPWFFSSLLPSIIDSTMLTQPTQPNVIISTLPTEPTVPIIPDTDIRLRHEMTVTKKGKINLECSYTLHQDTDSSGDTVVVTVVVKNVGKKFSYTGALEDQFDIAALVWDEDPGVYRIESEETPNTDDATEREFLHLETAEFVYRFAIPRDTQAGKYILEFSVFGISVRFDSLTAQTGRYVPFLGDLPEDVQKRLAGRYYNDMDYAYYSSRAPIYGEFGDVYVMIPRGPYHAVGVPEYINGLYFVYERNVTLHVYTSDGNYTLKDAFEAGIISAEQLQLIYDNYYWVHPEFLQN